MLKKNLYKWQKDTLELTKYENDIIISSPTGSGKTAVFMNWALDKNLKIIITAPIKSLSSQRFRELKKQGYNVALETGDIKFTPDNWEILCCTSEIYALKYAGLTDVAIIMDEFHYCFENKDRSRAFIDGVVASKAQAMCICSATLGNAEILRTYLNRISGRNFCLCCSVERVTQLKEVGKIPLRNLKNALVIAFSVKNCTDILEVLKADRMSKFYPNKTKKVSKKYKTKLVEKNQKSNEITKFAERFNVSGEVVENAKLGLALFHGKILPKEKDFIAELFEQRQIDTVIGTDALSIGVNFPVEKVVFCQLVKHPGLPISKNMLDQIAGRAGRKGYYDVGFYGYSNDLDDIEFKGFDTEEEYYRLINKKNENFLVELTPRIDLLLQNKTTIIDEVNYIVKYSSIRLNRDLLTDEIEYTLQEIKSYPDSVSMTEKVLYEFNTFIPYCYFNEFEPIENCEVLHQVLKTIDISDKIEAVYKNTNRKYTLEEIVNYICSNFNLKITAKDKEILANGVTEKNISKLLAVNTARSLINYFYVDIPDYYMLLKLRKYIKSLHPSLNAFVDLETIEEKINSIDSSSLNYNEE